MKKWKLESSAYWMFNKENWLFKILPALNVGYMPGYFSIDFIWLFGECSLILSNEDKLKAYLNSIAGEVSEEDSRYEEINRFPETVKEVKEFEVKHKLMIDGWPRRNRIDLYTPAELSIHNAIQEVEKVGAHTLLTNAVIKLQEAQDLVADYVELGKE